MITESGNSLKTGNDVCIKWIDGVMTTTCANWKGTHTPNTRYRLRSNGGILLSHPKFKTLTTLGNRAFVASAPTLWNDLRLDIRMAKSVDTFKKNFEDTCS